MEHVAKYTNSTVQTTAIKGTRILNFQCFVLCRNTLMPSQAPYAPPMRASIRSVDSGVRHLFFLAFRLSLPYITKARRFMAMMYVRM